MHNWASLTSWCREITKYQLPRIQEKLAWCFWKRRQAYYYSTFSWLVIARPVKVTNSSNFDQRSNVCHIAEEFSPGSLLAQSWKIKNMASYPLEKSNWFWRFTDIRIPLDPWDEGIFTYLCTLKKSTIDGSVYRNRPIYPSWGYQLHIEIPSW